MNKEIIKYIEKEIAFCDSKLRQCDSEFIKITERRNCYDDRKTMLFGLLELIEEDSEEKENRP